MHKLARLIVGIGNPSRGDDALGPALIERLADKGIPDTEWLTDFQLQVEYVLDLHGRDQIIFVDASVSAAAPYEFTHIEGREDSSYSSHAMSPQALLKAYERHYGAAPPPAYVLAIRGYGFELGEEISELAEANLKAAEVFLAGKLGSPK